MGNGERAAGARGDEVRHHQQPSTQMGKEKKGQLSPRAGMKMNTTRGKGGVDSSRACLVIPG